MKTKIIKIDDLLDIIYDYWNQMGDTISTKAKEYLEEQIDMCSIEIDMEEADKKISQ